jgi:uncharacterized protein (DUF2235 family)
MLGRGSVVKRIFIGIDGTANSAFFDKFYSNVYRINLALQFRAKDGSPQLFFYFSGVGTASYKWLGILGKAFGEGIDALILQAYVNLVSNYEPGDKIYVFGFSRGAVAARALTGLISRSGLVRYECSPLIATAWRHFLGDSNENYLAQKHNVTHPEAGVDFLGVWDTVNGISPESAKKKSLFRQLRFANFNLDASVKSGIHILSIDDTRKFFEPTPWDKASKATQKMEQIWLPGVHSDIGGGYSNSFISTVSLLTMIDRLAEHCPDVDFDANYIENVLVQSLSEDGNDIVINDEWSERFRILQYDRRRRCNSGAAELRQSVHPMLAAIEGRDIFCKTSSKKYAPTYTLSPADVALPVAEFGPSTYVGGPVADAIRAKLS